LRLSSRGIFSWLSRFRRVEQTQSSPRRGAVDHVVILDGTMSSLRPGMETNAGLSYKLLREMMPHPDLSVRYEAGIQWRDWRTTRDVIEGRGINRQIRRTYGALASRYRPGDRIFLIGYSRGAYAVRSLAGLMDRIGLLRADHATERNVTLAYRHYRYGPDSAAAADFRRVTCHEEAPIQAIGCWDTVKALGFRAPVVWKFSEPAHAFHNHDVGHSTRNAFHALALDEVRDAYRPVLWTTPSGFRGRLEQVWFRGTHGDVGGQLDGVIQARGLANIPLVWLLERMEDCGLRLPEGWQARFPQDPQAPSIGLSRGWGKFFLARHPRIVGTDRSEAIHPTAAALPEDATASA
jgi:uncharacterized protein (DUF2235 family)